MYLKNKLFLNLVSFDPLKTEFDIKQLKESLHNVQNYKKFLAITEAKGFYLFNSTFQIIYNLEKNLQSFNNKNNPNLKRVRMFKSSKAYLRKYHNHFETVLEVLNVIDQDNVIKKDVMTNLSMLFNNLQYDRDSTLAWLICDYLFYNYIKDKNLKILIFEKFGKNFSDSDTLLFEKLETIIKTAKLYSNFYKSYFMGLDLIESDFYKSAYIKLMHLYDHVEHKGYMNDNPKNIILQILSDIGSPIDLSDINTKNIYIKSIFDNIAILGSKKDTSLEGITTRFFMTMSKYYNENDSKNITETTIKSLLRH